MFSVPAISSGIASLAITNSVRFRAAASPYLSRSTWGTPTDAKKYTFSLWCKRGGFGVQSCLIYSNNGSPVGTGFFWVSGNQLAHYYGGASNFEQVTTDVFRDDTGHYHIVVAVDTTQATAADRVKMWVNGRQITSFGTANYPSLNATHQLTVNGIATFIGGLGGNYGDHYLSEIHFLDGTAKTADDFGQYNSFGQWEPIPYTGGSYGTNGFYLDFADGSAATAAALGDDASGNNNDFTPTNISVTAGITNDFLQDTPTTNYPIFSTLHPNSGTAATFGSAGMSVTTGNTGGAGGAASIALPKTGKWYFEFTLSATSTTNEACCGLVRKSGSESTSGFPYVLGGDGLGYYRDGQKYTYGSTAAYGNTFAVNDIIGVAVDCDNDKVYFSKNGTWQNSGDPPNGTNPAFSGQGVNSASYDFYPVVSDGASGDTATWHCNFGQRAFNSTPPTGFSALCVSNFPTPTIEYPTDYVNVKQYGGSGSSQSITF